MKFIWIIPVFVISFVFAGILLIEGIFRKDIFVISEGIVFLVIGFVFFFIFNKQNKEA